MKPLEDRLNDHLEQQGIATGFAEHQVNGARPPDPEIEELVEVARRFQAAPQLQANAVFASQLERRVLRHGLERQQKNAQGWFFLRGLRVHLALAGIVCALLFGIGALAVAAQATNPGSPFHKITQLLSPASTSAPADQATSDLKVARQQLHTLLSLADPAQSSAYLQALKDFEQQRSTAASAISLLPAGKQQQQLTNQLGALNTDARQDLRALLPNLTLTAGIATTAELGRLGMLVPRITGATLTLPTHPNEPATISIFGSGIQPGAQLLINGKQLSVTGTRSDGQITFVLDWNGNQHPHSLGIANPDATMAQTEAITIKTAKDDGNKNGNDNGSGNGKPTTTPTPPPRPTPHH